MTLTQWFSDLIWIGVFIASAGALLQLAVIAGMMSAWLLGERAVAWIGRRWIVPGAGPGEPYRRSLGAIGHGRGRRRCRRDHRHRALVRHRGLAISMAPNPLSRAEYWKRRERRSSRCPPSSPWRSARSAHPDDRMPRGGSEARSLGERRRRRATLLLYVPMLLPQIAFPFGIQVLLVGLGLDGGVFSVIWMHVVFSLPFVFLSLAEPYRRLDPRYERTALALGCPPDQVLLRVKLPMLLRPGLVALAVGFAVGVGQYLPTLIAGARVETLTNLAVGMSAGGDNGCWRLWGCCRWRCR